MDLSTVQKWTLTKTRAFSKIYQDVFAKSGQFGEKYEHSLKRKDKNDKNRTQKLFFLSGN